MSRTSTTMTIGWRRRDCWCTSRRWMATCQKLAANSARVVKTRFELDDALTAELIDAAVAAEHDAIDFYRFTSLLNRTLDEAGRQRVIEMMWQMAYIDGRVSEFEENVMWRVADLRHLGA